MSEEKPRVLSGIQPTSQMHIGNYFGAVSNWVRLQESEKFQCIYGVVDYHAMTINYEPAKLLQRTKEMIMDLLACGIDPEKSILFVQSLVPEHAEMAWLLGCVTSYGEMTRMTQFKDKSAQISEGDSQNSFISLGLFTYPLLQAADILIYKASYVPVGKDQEQHLELSRNIGQRFNYRFGEFFPEPKALFTKSPKIMSLADPTKKMSKSLGEKHYISLFEKPERIKKQIRSAVTDLGDSDEMSPGVANLFELLNACQKFDTVEELSVDYHEGRLKYVDLKDAAADALVETLAPIHERREEIYKDRKAMNKKMRIMSERARELAIDTIRETRKLMGLPAKKYLLLDPDRI